MHRPIFTIMVTLIVMILGVISLSRLPVDLMPDISYPTISVSTNYGNAAPQEMEKLVTRPIEEAMSAVAGVEVVTSTSSEGQSSVRVSFAWGTNLDAATNDVRDRLDRVIGRLPDDAERPTLRKYDPSAMPILILGAAGNLDLLEMRRIITDQVKYRIERVPGVAAFNLWGGSDREIQVNFFADKIKALGLSLDQVISAISAANKNVPGGTLTRGNVEVTIRTPGEYTNLAELRSTLITTRQGDTVRLGEIASVEDTTPKITELIRVNGKPGLNVAINKQSGANTVDVAQRVFQEVERINRDIPQIQLIPVVDTSMYIQRSITNVGRSALEGGLLTVFVLLFFLRNIPNTIVISTAIPISIIATFTLMYFSGFTLNIISLGGLALGVGMMVDNSIVVLENIHRLRETGRSRFLAAIDGSMEVTAPIIAGTLTAVAVFLPLIFVRGMSGVMFKQLAYVTFFSHIASLLVALTLIPTLSARMQHAGLTAEAGNQPPRKHRLYRASEQFFRHVEDGYKHLLDVALNHRISVSLISVALVVGSLGLLPFIGVELMPKTDEGEVNVTVEMETGTRLDVLDTTLKPIEALVTQAVPEAKVILANVGGGHGGGARSSELRIMLKPLNERSRSSEAIAAALRRQLTNIPGVQIRVRSGQGMFMMRMFSSGAEAVQIEIRGYDFKTADALIDQIQRMVKTVPGVTDVRLSRQAGGLEDLILIDRLKAADLKLSVTQIADMLKTVMGGTVASYYREGGDEFPIRVKLKDAERLSIQQLLDLTITNSAGEQIVLRNVVSVGSQTSPTRIERKNQERIATISANISGRDMGSIVADIRAQLAVMPVPRDFSIGFGGDVEEQQKAFRELLLSLILSLILVYMVMACQYESLRDPFVVMFSVPLAIIGVILMLFLTNTTFNIQSYIGCIMLGGIVVNNAILLVDTINLLRRRDNFPLREAIEEAGRRRLRPILMTTLTTILGLVPLALALGEGSEAQAPLARAVIGGLSSSTLITLIFIPVVYSFVERMRKNDPVQSSVEDLEKELALK